MKTAKQYTRNCILFVFLFGVMLFNAGFFFHVVISRGSYAAFIFWSALGIFWGFAMVWNGLRMVHSGPPQCPEKEK
jgi:hypothetical protein